MVPISLRYFFVVATRRIFVVAKTALHFSIAGYVFPLRSLLIVLIALRSSGRVLSLYDGFISRISSLILLSSSSPTSESVPCSAASNEIGTIPDFFNLSSKHLISRSTFVAEYPFLSKASKVNPEVL